MLFSMLFYNYKTTFPTKKYFQAIVKNVAFEYLFCQSSILPVYLFLKYKVAS
jgi:hypothetical protein